MEQRKERIIKEGSFKIKRVKDKTKEEFFNALLALKKLFLISSYRWTSHSITIESV